MNECYNLSVFFYKTFMIIWILINFYRKNLKDLNRLYKFVRFKRIVWVFKNISKITRISEKSNKKWWGMDKKVKPI